MPNNSFIITSLPLTFAGDDVNTPFANAVVRIGGCTGTLIAPDVVITAGHCISQEARGPRQAPALTLAACPDDWQDPNRWYPLMRTVTIRIGNNRTAPLFTTTGVEYTLPVCADMIMIRLAERVPAEIALPSQVLVSAGDGVGGRDAPRFRDMTLTMVGWGGTETGDDPNIRQIGTGRYERHTDEKMFVNGTGDTVAQPGDSGGPLFWTHASGTRYLIAVLQGFEGSLSRYTPTFRTPVNGKPSVAAWIQRAVPSAVYCPEAANAPNGTIPLISWWSGNRNDNLLTSNPGWAGCHGAVRTPDYGFVRTEGFIFDPLLPQPPGTVPLSSWYDRDRGDNFATSQPQWQLQPADSRQRSPNYGFSRLEGYVFDPDRPQPAGTVPLYRWYDPTREDNWTTTQHRRTGQAGAPLEPNYRFSRLEGYVYHV